MPTSVADVIEEHFFFVKGTSTYLALGILVCWGDKRGISVGHKGCMCGHWQREGEMDCNMWPGF